MTREMWIDAGVRVCETSGVCATAESWSMRDPQLGGCSGGRRWSSKNTTSEYLRLDVRRLDQEGVLERRGTASWQWTRNDQPYANICLQPEPDRVVLSYRHRSGGEDWKSEEDGMLLPSEVLMADRLKCRCDNYAVCACGGCVLCCPHEELPETRALQEEAENQETDEEERKCGRPLFGGGTSSCPPLDRFLQYPTGIADRVRYVVERITDLND
jgi:hypothetical protein